MKKGFSIPNVIMSVVIIGLVIFIAFPKLLDSYKKQQYATALKTAYSNFNEALDNLADDNNCAGDLRCTNLFDVETSDKTFGDALVKYFKVKKNCGTKLNQGCFAKFTNVNYDGSSSKVYELDEWSGYRFITEDGASFYVWNYSKDCSENDSSGKTGNLTQACGEIYVDTNGPQEGPNYMGIDTFNFWISNGKGGILYPMGGMDTKWGTEDWRWKNPDTDAMFHCYPGDKTGWPCAGRIMEEGWQMKY